MITFGKLMINWFKDFVKWFFIVLVNSELVQRFLKSIIFSFTKLSMKKDILMSIDFEKAC